MPDPNFGRLLNNRHRMVDIIGQGSMGRVYKAEDTLLGGMPVAVKLLAQTLVNQKMRDRFYREATISALLSSRSNHIVRVYDYGIDEQDEMPFYVMEHLQGNNLSEIILQQPLMLGRFLNLSRQICLGLQTAHQGIPIEGTLRPIVHRDIKPSNIFVVQDPTMGELAKILDFGIAKALSPDAGETGSFMGTLAYSSPEQMEGLELDSRSDIYSLGVMMYQMLVGKMPIYADTQTFGSWYRAHREQMPRPFEAINASLKVPKELERLVLSCLSKRPGDRPQSAAEVIQELEPIGDRYERGYKLGQRLKERIEKELPPPPTAKPAPRVPAVDDILWHASWPVRGGTQEEVSFHKIMPTGQRTLPTLWVMLSEKEVQHRQICTRYNQFLFAQAPHPTLLWLTVLFNRQHGPRWIPQYLDLKSPEGQKMVRLLSEEGEYRLLLFSLEKPNRCTNVLTSTIAPTQRTMLQDWAMTGQLFSPHVQQFKLTKQHLRAELERLKPQTLMKLESLYTDSGDFSG